MHSVLVVEDEGIVATDLQQTLDAMGYDAFAIASSGEEALSRASERCPDVVLMDIRIKGARDGIETAALLRERFGVPVIYLTAHADDATLERAKKTEPHGYLMKPVKAAELRSAIEVSIYKHEMETRLRERERWFSTTLRSIADAVITVDLAGNVTFMNPAAALLTGVSAEAAMGRPAREIVRLLDPMQPASPLDVVLSEKRNLVIEEAPLERHDAPSRIISDSASMVVDDGQILGAVMVFRDVTEQKVLQKQLELTDRLASLGTMAAGVAHEVNNPLAVVIGNATYVREELMRHRAGLVDDPVALASLDEAISAQRELESAASRIARIISELQAFARPAQPAGIDGDVARAVEWAVRSTAHEFRSRGSVVTDVPNDLPHVEIDETRIGQILVNLMMNAAHSLALGQYERNQVTIKARVDAGVVVVEIKDTGTGMSPEILRRIFEPFYTTKPVGVGTGLGLAICHGIVTAAGGRLEVKSTVGIGTTFRVSLPAAPLVATPDAGPAPQAAVRKGRILAIDDEPMVLQALRRMLREHEVVGVDQPRDALAMLLRGDRFDVILSDIMMPQMTGVGLYEELLVHRPELARRIVFMTGGAVSSRVADFLAVVPNVCLEKPFSAVELRAFIAQLLAEP